MRWRDVLDSRWVTAAAMLSIAGCGWFSGEADGEVEEEAVVESSAGKTSRDPTPTAPPLVKEKLELKLKVGDRFPLMKTVVHTLRQPSPVGWITSHSSLELLLSVTVEEVYKGDPTKSDLDTRAGQKRFQVRYHRVRFSQELPGQPKIEYDSADPPRVVPLVAQGYHGLKDNSFQFWLSADNQIVEMIGFEQFIDRCLKHVPPDRRVQVRATMAATTGADGIANFVDDSIGLLPTTAVREGDSWKRDRQVLQPLPLHSSTQYTLRKITPDIAEIDILGAISPSSTYGPSNQPNKDLNVTIRGGHVVGQCLLDRRTGLPVQSRVEQGLEMNVKLADGSEFDQHKSTLTTIKYFPDQSPSSRDAITVAAPPADRRAQ